MRLNITLLLCFIMATAGCHEHKGGGEAREAEKPKPAAAEAKGQVNLELLKPLRMSAKPGGVISIRDVLNKKEGEQVVFSGRTPPENVKPYNAAVAAFVLLAPEDMEKPDVKEELACEDAATCPRCKQILDKYAVRVELVDASGAVLPTTVEGFENLKPGSSITVEGEVKRDGKDKKLVRVVARKFYPG